MYDPVIGKYILKNWELIKIIISEIKNACRILQVFF